MTLFYLEFTEQLISSRKIALLKIILKKNRTEQNELLTTVTTTI